MLSFIFSIYQAITIYFAGWHSLRINNTWEIIQLRKQLIFFFFAYKRAAKGTTVPLQSPLTISVNTISIEPLLQKRKLL